MGRRIDYYDDPDAPTANSLVPSVNVVVVNDAGQILLIKRSDNDNWALPGGAIDLGESMTDAGVRETKEETGIDCEIVGLVGIYSDPHLNPWVPPVSADMGPADNGRRNGPHSGRYPGPSDRPRMAALPQAGGASTWTFW